MNWTKELTFLSKVHIKQTNKDHINISCPICGEGSSGSRKARGYVLKKDDKEPAYYFCHNDSNCSGSFGKKLLPHLGYDPKEYFRLFYENKVDTFKKKKEKKKPKVVDEKKVDEFLTKAHTHPLLESLTTAPITKVVSFTKQDSVVSYGITLLKSSREGREYCYNRGMTEEIIKDWFYVPKIHHILIPFYVASGEIYGFQTRSIYDKQFHIELFGDNHKFYGIQTLVDGGKDPIYIFESIFNALSPGYDRVCASLGTTIPKEFLPYLPIENTYFVFDGDSKGVEAMQKYMKMGYKCIRHTNKDVDINDMLRQGESAYKIRHYIETNMLDPSSANQMRIRMRRRRSDN